jgi:tetratricopeptide (TPR) repeat protein
LIDIPTHNFVRWDFKDGTYLDYETMDGVVSDDTYYRRNWGIPDDFVGRGGILRSMTELESFAYHDAVVAVAWSWRNQNEKMIQFYLRAISRDPTRAFSLNNLAWYYAAFPDHAKRDGSKAVEYAKRAVGLFPDGDNLDTLACAYAQLGDFLRARSSEADAAASGYTPFGSNIADDMALFVAGQSCNDPAFGTDPQPFRPHQPTVRPPTAREILRLH